MENIAIIITMSMHSSISFRNYSPGPPSYYFVREITLLSSAVLRLFSLHLSTYAMWKSNFLCDKVNKWRKAMRKRQKRVVMTCYDDARVCIGKYDLDWSTVSSQLMDIYISDRHFIAQLGNLGAIKLRFSGYNIFFSIVFVSFNI